MAIARRTLNRFTNIHSALIVPIGAEFERNTFPIFASVIVNAEWLSRAICKRLQMRPGFFLFDGEIRPAFGIALCRKNLSIPKIPSGVEIVAVREIISQSAPLSGSSSF